MEREKETTNVNVQANANQDNLKDWVSPKMVELNIPNTAQEVPGSDSDGFSGSDS